jgi:hypothetical protein
LKKPTLQKGFVSADSVVKSRADFCSAKRSVGAVNLPQEAHVVSPGRRYVDLDVP